MTFDNSKTVYGVRIKLFFATILMLGYVGVVYAAKLIKFPVLGLDDSIWTLILVAIYLFFAFLPSILNYQYIYYSDEGESIVFRYFTAGIVGGRKNSVEIKKNTFSGFQTESKYFGLNKSLILFQKSGQQIARYPPIHISGLTREQRKKLLQSLAVYAPST